MRVFNAQQTDSQFKLQHDILRNSLQSDSDELKKLEQQLKSP